MDLRRYIPRGLGPILCAINLALLFALALWFRVTSLEAFPEPNGDEAWYGVQAGHLIRGAAFSPRTGNGNPVNPFHAGFEVLLLLAFKPSLWILRVSAVVGGVAAVGLTYPLMSRALDRTTALIAAALLAVLPIAILYSRIGYDCSQTPAVQPPGAVRRVPGAPRGPDPGVRPLPGRPPFERLPPADAAGGLPRERGQGTEGAGGGRRLRPGRDGRGGRPVPEEDGAGFLCDPVV